MIGVGWSRPALQAWLCLFGTLGMTLTAGLERHILFLVLNAVVLAGNLAAFTNFPALIKSLIPLSVAAPTLLFLIQAKL